MLKLGVTETESEELFRFRLESNPGLQIPLQERYPHANTTALLSYIDGNGSDKLNFLSQSKFQI